MNEVQNTFAYSMWANTHCATTHNRGLKQNTLYRNHP